MKMQLRLFLGVAGFILLVSNYTTAQTLEFVNKDNSYYLRFAKRGTIKDGVQVGKWLNVNFNNIVYKEYYFDEFGKPVGTWKLFYPNGSLRKEMEYENNRVVRYTRFSMDSVKCFELITNEGFSDSLYFKIENHEEDIFDAEGRVSEIIFRNLNGRVESKRVFIYDYYEGVDDLIKILNAEKFTGTIDVWNVNKDHWKKNIFKEGNYRSIVDSYKQGVLQYQKEYDENGKKARITKYDEKGNVVYEKSYN
ncbi:MAG TPA: hypothetical protein PLJ84_06175 [Bacteroidales bacterium]|nr:hypothetical protein [Bacteroidales bacterium]